MNWVDLIIIGLLIFFALEGLGRSFIEELLDFISFLLAFFLSLRFYNQAAVFFQTQFQIAHSISNVLGFIIIWFLVEIAFFACIRIFFYKFNKLTFLHKVNRYLNHLSVVPAFFRGLIFVSIIVVLLGTFPIQPKIKLAVNQSIIGAKLLSGAHRLETPLKNIFGGITEDTLTFLTIKPKSNETVNLGFQTDEFSSNERLEKEMIEMVNKERTKRGLKFLEYDSRLLPIAREHSADMFKRGYFSHYSPEGKNVADRANNKSIEYLVIGENLAYAPTLPLAHEGLMNSVGHRANILSIDYNKIAIGIMDGGVYGLMITQVFSN